MRDRLEDFNDLTTEELGDAPSDPSLWPPGGSYSEANRDNQTGIERLYKAAVILLVGRYNDVVYQYRDRLVILLKALLGGVAIAAMISVSFDMAGISSGLLWDVQVVARNLIMLTITTIGDLTIHLVNNPLLTLLVVLAVVGLINYRR